LGVALAVAILGAAKANDGAASIFFPFSRICLALPWMVCALVVLPGRSPGGRRVSDRQQAVAAVVIAVVALLGAGVREVRLERRLDTLLVAAAGQPPVAPSRTADLERRCSLRRDAAKARDVTVILDRYDRTATYGCAALLPRSVLTLFPEYDRRSWVQRAAERRSVSRVLVSGLDACPPAPLDCTLVDEADRLYLVSGTARPITAWATDLGLPVRPLPG
jgi:hypothetical protein